MREKCAWGFGMSEEVKLSVNGMHCIGCAEKVRSELSTLGIQDSLVDLSSNTATFTLPEGLSIPRVLNRLKDLGYPSSMDDLNAKRSHALEWKFAISAVLSIPLVFHMFLHIPYVHDPYVQLLIALPVFIIGVLHFGTSALNAVRNGTTNMDVLIILGVVAAFVYSVIGTVFGLGEEYYFYETATTIIAFVLFGNLLEKIAVKKTTSAIEALVSLKPSKARRVLDGGSTEEIEARALSVGDTVLVHLGEAVPMDGTVISGEALIDESMVTGESSPVKKASGAKIVGGTLVASGNVTIKVTAVGADTVLSKIVSLVQEAQGRKPSIQNLGDRVSEIFVPVVIGISILTFCVTWLALLEPLSESLLRAIAVLVIACPCAMGLATPAAVMVGLGNAARRGVLIKGGDTAELLSKVKRVVFDKTGTLTKGRFSILSINMHGIDEDEAKSAIRGLEEYSSHPLADSLKEELSNHKPLSFNDVKEVSGVGVFGKSLSGDDWSVGGLTMAREYNPSIEADLYVIKNGKIVSTIKLADTLKNDSHLVISKLHELGIKSAIVSGDRKEKCEAIGKELGIDEIFSEQSPEEKVKTLQSLSRGDLTAFVGDGVNDAPSLAASAVGVSFSDASHAAMQSAQVVLLSDRLSRLIDAIITARETHKTIKENLFWAFFYNVTAIPIAAAGFLTPMVAAFAMAFSDLFVIGNSLRRLSFSKSSQRL